MKKVPVKEKKKRMCSLLRSERSEVRIDLLRTQASPFVEIGDARSISLLRKVWRQNRRRSFLVGTTNLFLRVSAAFICIPKQFCV